MHKDFNKTAKIIAKALSKLDVDYRGNALLEAGVILKTNHQSFTGNMLKSAAIEYGVNPKGLKR